MSASCWLGETTGLSKERRIAWFMDNYNYILFRYDQVVEQLLCICVINEQWVFYEYTDIPLSEWDGSDNLWHTLTIRILGNQLTCLRDDEVIFEASDPVFRTMPKIGYVELANTYLETCFDDVLLTSLESGTYLCGDVNADNKVNVSDAVYIINYVFSGGSAPVPLESGDSNCDGNCNLGDAVYIINYVFSNGYPPCDTDGDLIPEC